MPWIHTWLAHPAISAISQDDLACPLFLSEESWCVQMHPTTEKKKKKTPARSKNFVSLSLPLEEPPNVTAKSRIIFLFARNTSGFPHLETQLKLSPRCPQSFHVTANGHPSTLPSSSFWISFLSNCQKPDFLAPSSECSFHSWAATENLLCAC